MSIQEHLNKIRNAIYGREVRESIAKGIETAYDDASEKDNANMEVKIARGTHPNLRSRLDGVDNKQQQAAEKIDSNYNEVTEKIDSNHNEVTTQLAQSFNLKRDKSVPIGLNDVSSDLLTAIQNSDGTPVEVLSIPRDSSVTPIKTTFLNLQEGTNRFNKQTIEDGGYYDENGSWKTHIIVNSSDFISVKTGDVIRYLSDGISSPEITQWNSDGNFVTGQRFTSEEYPEGSVIEVTVSEPTVTKVRVSVLKSSLDKLMVTINQDMPSTYLGYSSEYSLSSEVKIKQQLENENVSKYIKPNSITPSQTTFIEGSPPKIINWFDKTDIEERGFYNRNGKWETHPIVNSSHFISVKVGDVIRYRADGTASPVITQWNSDGNFVTGQSFPSVEYPEGSVIEVTVSEPTVTKVKVSVLSSSLDTLMVTINQDMPLTYLGYNEFDYDIKLGKSFKRAINDVVGYNYGTKLSGFGDSIMFGYTPFTATKMSNPWINQVGDLLGFTTVNNYGISGSTIATDSTGAISSTWDSDRNPMVSRLDSIDTTSDVIILEGGINDFWLGVPIGTMNSRDTDTFYGSLHAYYGGVSELMWDKKIIVMTILPSTKTNPNGVTHDEWANAQKEVAKYYSLPVFDAFSLGGINPVIESQLTNYMPDGIHINQLAADRFSRRFVNFIKTL